MTPSVTEYTDDSLHGEIIAHEFGVPGSPTVLQYADIKKALVETGFDENCMQDLSAVRGFRRACKSLKEGRVIRKLEKNGTVITFQFTEESLHQGHYSYSHEADVCLDTETGDVTCEESAQLAELAKKLIDGEVATRNTSDVSRVIKALCQKNADLFPITRKGAAYFVPIAHRAFIDRIEKFVERCGGILSRFPVPKGTKKGDIHVASAVSSGLKSLLSELDESVQDWDSTTRGGTQKGMKARYDMLQMKAEAYGDMFTDAKSDLDEAIKQSRIALSERIDQLTEPGGEEGADDGNGHTGGDEGVGEDTVSATPGDA